MSEFIFIKGLDSVGDDKTRIDTLPKNRPNKLSINELPAEARDSVCFNTLGYCKNSVGQLTKSPYFSESDGLYVKNIVPNFPIKVINLDRRPDRWTDIKEKLDKAGLTNYSRFSAIDGTKLEMNEYIKHTFRNNDFNYLQGYIGCALSHIELWKQLSKSDEDYYIIMEDDIELVDDFEAKLNLVLHSMINNPFMDVSFLGYFYWKGKPEKSSEYPIVKMMEIPKYMGGFYGYIISKASACKLLNIIKYKGIQNGIDRFMHIHFNKMLVTNCEPHIIFSDYATNANSKDSDIQRNYNPVGDDKIKVKLICNWLTFKGLANYWSKMTKGNKVWNNIRITDSNDADYFVIINKPGPTEYYDPKRTMIFHMEPWVHDEAKKWGVKTWGKWAEPDPNVFMKVLTHKYHHNLSEWHLNKTYTELLTYVPEKSKSLSTFISGKMMDEGHIKRFSLVKFLEEKNMEIDVFGKGGKGYIKDKDDGLFPYKYTICVENNSEYNYFTEKINDGILAECLCFYWGCPNLEDYIPSDSFIRINLDNPEECYQVIKKAIETNQWEKRIESIREAKKKILNELSPFASIEKVINEHNKPRVTPLIHAGLCNQLFMIANAYSVAKDKNFRFVLNNLYLGGRHHYYDTYLKNLKYEKIDLQKFSQYHETRFEYNPVTCKVDTDISLLGYYQSEKYFEKYKDEIFELFQIPNDIKDKVVTKFKSITKENNINVCVHIRRGDYCGSDLHYVQPLSYYSKAKEFIEDKLKNKNISYIYFSDDKQWVRDNMVLNDDDVIIDYDLADYEEFSMMQLCDSFIIANSSFSWWASWLGTHNKSGIVVAPSVWFIGDKLNTKDIIPDRWYKI